MGESLSLSAQRGEGGTADHRTVCGEKEMEGATLTSFLLHPTLFHPVLQVLRWGPLTFKGISPSQPHPEVFLSFLGGFKPRRADSRLW